MTQSSALKYNLLIIEANRLGRRMKLLAKATANMAEPPYIDDYFDGFEALAEKLWGIGTVLNMLGETPNAYINAEAMEALRAPVEFAAGIEEEEWAKELLKDDNFLTPIVSL
jgi:nitrate reductase beta subunit